MKSPQIVRAIVGLLLLGTGAEGATRSARVRWSPSPSAGVAGYRLYVRPVGSNFGIPRNAGLPTPSADGSLAFTVSGLDTAISYAFAVTAVTPSAESPLSNELVLNASAPPDTTSTTLPRQTTTSTLPRQTTTSTSSSSTSTSSTTSTTLGPACAVDAECLDANACTVNERCENGHCALDELVCLGGGPCAEAICDPDTGCHVDPHPDGSDCPSADPCIPGTCSDGACIPPDLSPGSPGTNGHFLAVNRLLIRAGRTGRRLVGRASFAVSTLIDPTVAGGLVELRNATGDVVYQAIVPASTWRANRTRRSFRYASANGRRAPASAHGLTRIVLRIRGAIADVSLAGSSADLEPIAQQSALSMMLQLGDQCVRDPALDCRPAGNDTACQ